MRFGFFGGSFDPVHRAHIALIRAALRELKLDRLYVVPAGHPPHKSGLNIPDKHRLALLRASLPRDPRVTLSLWELKHPDPSYTERTLHAFRKRFPKAEWTLIIGGDSYKNFTRWRRWQKLLGESHLAVGLRPGVSVRGVPPEVRRRTVLLKTPMPDVSSTHVRERLKQGGSVAGLLPVPAARYIKKQGLYQ